MLDGKVIYLEKKLRHEILHTCIDSFSNNANIADVNFHYGRILAKLNMVLTIRISCKHTMVGNQDTLKQEKL